MLWGGRTLTQLRRAVDESILVVKTIPGESRSLTRLSKWTS